MDPYSILDNNSGEVPSAGEAVPVNDSQGWAGEPVAESPRFPAEDGGRSLAEMARRDLDATLQLLAERAQYITSATGAAIALSNGDGMVCRASAGRSAPEVGAELQVNSGLSGESVRTRQTLRCDDAVTDERVNRESCEALGIRSVVVMPLLQGEKVVGVFELFSDKANVFQARDITALERMGSMVHTALEESTTVGSAVVVSMEAMPAVEETAIANDRAEDPRTVKDEEIPHQEPPQAQATEVASPRVTEPAESGRIEELAATLETTSGIAFHRRVPTHSKTTPPPEAAPSDGMAANSTTPAVEDQPAASSAATKAGSAEQSVEDAMLPEAPSSVPASEAVIEEEDVLELPDIVPAKAEADPLPDDVLAAEPSPAALPVTPSKPEIEVRAEASSVVPAAETAKVVPAPIANLRKCEACGFPVSEGRQLCLDCEKKNKAEVGGTDRAPLRSFHPPEPAPEVSVEGQEGDLTLFQGSEEEEASWLATHRLMVIAVALAVLVIVVLMLMR
jgi:GAF domain-containing protein